MINPFYNTFMWLSRIIYDWWNPVDSPYFSEAELAEKTAKLGSWNKRIFSHWPRNEKDFWIWIPLLPFVSGIITYLVNHNPGNLFSFLYLPLLGAGVPYFFLYIHFLRWQRHKSDIETRYGVYCLPLKLSIYTLVINPAVAFIFLLFDSKSAGAVLFYTPICAFAALIIGFFYILIFLFIRELFSIPMGHILTGILLLISGLVYAPILPNWFLGSLFIKDVYYHRSGIFIFICLLAALVGYSFLIGLGISLARSIILRIRPLCKNSPP